MNKKPLRGPWTFRDAASILFPQRCPLCDGVLPLRPRVLAPLSAPGQRDIWLHKHCRAEKLRVKDPACIICGAPLGEEGGACCPHCQKQAFHFKQNKALWRYEEPLRSAIARFKYQGRQQYALFFARAWMQENRKYLEEVVRPQLLIPVPIHKSRLRKRGYNQAALIAYELEKLSGIPCREDILIRSKHTGAQKDLNPAQRLRNMENAFRLKKSAEGIKRVLIVDDIFTTGSTLESISRVLTEAGVQEIYAATLCVVEKEATAPAGLWQ